MPPPSLLKPTVLLLIVLPLGLVLVEDHFVRLRRVAGLDVALLLLEQVRGFCVQWKPFRGSPLPRWRRSLPRSLWGDRGNRA